MVYPPSGIANSTGSAWGTSYGTSGSGTTVALTASPTFTGTVTMPLTTAGIVTTTSGGVIGSEASATVAQGGTGTNTLTSHGVVIGQGTSAVNITAAGTSGQPLLSGGASADPAYGTLGAKYGGTALDTSSSTGVPLVTAGTWSAIGYTAHDLIGDSGSAYGKVALDGTLGLTAGTLAVTTATTSQLGAVKPDGTTITITGGVISSSAGSGTQLNDTNGNAVIKTTPTISPVNQFTASAATTGNAPSISATGTDTNIPILLTPKGNAATQSAAPIALLGLAFQTTSPFSSSPPTVPTATTGTCSSNVCSNDAAVACTKTADCNLGAVVGVSNNSAGFGIATKSFLNWMGMNPNNGGVVPGDCVAYASDATINYLDTTDSGIPCSQATQIQAFSQSSTLPESDFPKGTPIGGCHMMTVKLQIDTFTGTGTCTEQLTPQIIYQSCNSTGTTRTTIQPVGLLSALAVNGNNQSYPIGTYPLYTASGSAIGVSMIWAAPINGSCPGVGYKYTATLSVN